MDFTDFSKEMEVWGITSVVFPATLTLTNIIKTAIFAFTVSLVFSIFPARRASKLKPIEAIRHL